MSKLSTLPDLCVLAILDRVPVHDLYHTVPLVCKRYTTLHDTACHRRKTLILVESEHYLSCVSDEHSRFSSCILKHAVQQDGSPFTSDTIPVYNRNACLICPFERFCPRMSLKLFRLTQLFPNIQTLKMIHFNLPISAMSCNVYRMLNVWAQSLKKLQLSLHIHTPTDDQRIKSCIEKIINCISGSMATTLTGLYLDIDFSCDFNGNVSFDMNILSNLESFNFSLKYGLHRYEGDELLHSLQTYSSNRLHKIIVTNPLRLESLVRLEPELAQKFREVLVRDEIVLDNVDNFKLFCSQFTSLTVLMIGIVISDIKREFRQMIRPLAKLKQLIHLTLNIDFNIENEGNAEDEDGEDEVTKLSSVVALTFFVPTKSHHDLAQFDLPAIMPNVQVVQLQHDSSRCAECGYGPFTWNQLDSFVKENNPMIGRMQLCMKQARRTLIGFEKLNILIVNKMPKRELDEYSNSFAVQLTRDELIQEV